MLQGRSGSKEGNESVESGVLTKVMDTLALSPAMCVVLYCMSSFSRPQTSLPRVLIKKKKLTLCICKDCGAQLLTALEPFCSPVLDQIAMADHTGAQGSRQHSFGIHGDTQTSPPR